LNNEANHNQIKILKNLRVMKGFKISVLNLCLLSYLRFFTCYSPYYIQICFKLILYFSNNARLREISPIAFRAKQKRD